MQDFIDRYTALLRERAADRRAEGSPLAGAYDWVAEDLAKAFAAYCAEPVTASEASRLTGMSERSIWRMKADGRVQLRRGALPQRLEGPATPGGSTQSLAERRLARQVGA